jgi:hypothetical protein
MVKPETGAGPNAHSLQYCGVGSDINHLESLAPRNSVKGINVFWKVTVDVRSQLEESNISEISREALNKCTDETEVYDLLWQVTLQPILRITRELAGTPFSKTLEHRPGLWDEGGGGFMLEDFDLEIWKRNNTRYEEDDFEEDVYYYRAYGSGFEFLVVEAESEQAAIDLVLEEAKNVLYFWTDADEFNGEPFYKIEQVLVKSVEPLEVSP